MTAKPFRGEIWWVDWSPGRGSEQIGRRPSLIIQNDIANQSRKYANTIVLAISTRPASAPFHITLTPSQDNGLTTPSCIQCEQIFTVSCDRLHGPIGCISTDELRRVDHVLRRVLGLIT